MIRHLGTAIGVLSCLLLLSGCGKSGEPAEQRNAQSRAKKQGPPARDACTLITVEEVAAAYGAPVKAIPEIKGSDFSSCEFADPAKGDFFVFAIDVHWKGGREGWSILHSGTAAATRVMDNMEEGIDSASIIAVGPVPNLGDRAIFSGLLGGHVLKDDRLIDFKFGVMPDPERHFRPLAEIVLARL